MTGVLRRGKSGHRHARVRRPWEGAAGSQGLPTSTGKQETGLEHILLLRLQQESTSDTSIPEPRQRISAVFSPPVRGVLSQQPYELMQVRRPCSCRSTATRASWLPQRTAGIKPTSVFARKVPSDGLALRYAFVRTEQRLTVRSSEEVNLCRAGPISSSISSTSPEGRLGALTGSPR